MSIARSILTIAEEQTPRRSSRDFLRILHALDRLNRTVISEIADAASSALMSAVERVEEEDDVEMARAKVKSGFSAATDELREITQTIDDMTDIIRRKREVDQA